ASCVRRVEHALDALDDVDAAAVNLATRTATVRTSRGDLEPLLAAVRSAGYGATPHERARAADEDEHDIRRRLWVAAPLTIAILVLTFGVEETRSLTWLIAAMASVVQWYGGWPFLVRAGRAARHGAATMDTLVAIGSLAAYLYSLWAVVDATLAPTPMAGGMTASPAMAHYFDTGAVIITLILVGRLLEARARMAAGDAARALLARAATDARVLDADGTERSVPIDELRPGMRVAVLPGEKIPADGVVREGTSWVDLSLLTGESVPVDVGPGDDVIGASVNGHGRLVVFVTRSGEHATLAEIVRSLQAAQGSKAKVQQLADRVSSIFVPIVLSLAAATFLGWLAFTSVSAGQALLHATAVVLIACPCALGLATPAAIMAGAGRAAELGILVRGGESIERARAVDLVVFDKTGTLTEGRMVLTEVEPVAPWTAAEVLALAAAVEAGSEHPIARAVVAAARERGGTIAPARDHGAVPGAGAVAVVDGAEVRVGRVPADDDAAPTVDAWAARGLTPFEVARAGRRIGLLAVADVVKPEAASTVAALRSMGVDAAMVTGDRAATAAAIADVVGIDDVTPEVYPDGKVDAVARRRAAGDTVAFVGDGLNDAPALAAADVGIALGTGTDVALAAADVQLLGGSLRGVVDALAISRRTYRVVSQNLFWAFAYNVVMIPLAIVGALDPTLAAAAMALSSLTVVLNALRLRRFGRSTSREVPAAARPSGAVRDPAPS
ncbi:MAG TPA: heavy metal translocating P-type ATPase, partial [Actinomycetota bacterium]|nr:heavy metal translocating P-type ATPase [Actinomycetota bacterium]